LAFEYDPPPSVISHFEPADLLDALSVGVVLLDAQLCVIYANSAAQDALAFRVDQARGRPFADFIGQSIGLVSTLRRVLETGVCIADREHSARPLGSPHDASGLDVTITPLGSQVTGRHLLLEF
jgi:nitrogen-specific signal transduction histidine kinase